jgi:hypothetical protein
MIGDAAEFVGPRVSPRREFGVSEETSGAVVSPASVES